MTAPKDGGAAEAERDEAAVQWIRALLRRHGVQTMPWGNGEFGVMNVPRKWGGIISDMATAIQLLAAGEPLPEFAPEKKRARRDGGGE